MKPLRAIVLVALFAVAQSPAHAGKPWTRSKDGWVTITPPDVPAECRSAAWPKEWEAGFADRANYVIRKTARGGRYGNTFFENEKRAYGYAMLSLLGGYEEPALKMLQERDNLADRWNRNTLGIDYYPCFTLKHQMRKYFYFGSLLDPAYRKRMKDAAKVFTEKDPLNRPHYAYAKKPGWGPDAKNSWVDIRNTDNLKLMRDTSVYLLAEEAGNAATRELYKQKLITFIATMYHTGMGEWDSENYLGHSIAPLLNLYDFATDRDVQKLAKAGLDWMAAALAVKYRRGAYNGPTRRDYNHPYPFGGSAAFTGWQWFGNSPVRPEEFEPDAIHIITSAYRPPTAVVHLAHKRLARPVEIVANKPEWEAWRRPHAKAPTYRETQYLGRTFQFGTLARGTQAPDINGFKILVDSATRGADTILAAPTSEPLKLGSPQYQKGLLAPHSTVGQNANFAIYLTAESDHPYLWLVPVDAKLVRRGGAWFLLCEKTTVAIWPMNLSAPVEDAKLTERIQVRVKKQKKGPDKREPRWVTSRILRADRKGPGVYGFAIEIDDGDREAFLRKAVACRPETGELAQRGAAAMTATSGRRLRVQWGRDLGAIKIWRDGRLRRWDAAEEMASYHTRGGVLIEQAWQGGTLRVQAGGTRFECTVSRDGKARFRQR